jgi:actin-like ATPase involved in cell morphogenesis/GTPase SAR1 family protein
MSTTGWTLAIDYGTTNTCAAIAGEGQAPELLEIEDQWRLPSLVVVDRDGRLRTGKAAKNLLKVDARRGERTPKRYLGSSLEILPIGISVVDAVAAVLARVAEAARKRQGGDPSRVVLTHPVRWEELRLERLRAAAEKVGLPDPELVPEPVAAALHFAAKRHVEAGAAVAVYDLGGGTFDTAVLRSTGTGFDIAGQPGGDTEIGGERFDEALLRFVGERIAEIDADLWERLADPEDDRERAVQAIELRASVREAKEELSRELYAHVHVEPLQRDIRVTKDEFEGLIAQAVAETVEGMAETLTLAEVVPSELAALYLTGDSTRIPAIFRALHQRFAPLEPTTWDDPKAVVALGASRAAALVVEPERQPGVVTLSSGPAPERLGQLVDLGAALCDEVGLEGAAQRLRGEKEQSTRPEVSVVVVGETKRGKSSLINALVGHQGLVPVDADVATAVYLEVVHAEAPLARVFTEDDTKGQDIPLDEVAEYGSMVGNPDNDKGVTSVKVGVPSVLLAQGLTLIDTPGVGGLEAGHKQITLATLSLADALLLVVDATAPLTASELAFLFEATDRIETVLLALTKVDAHPGWREILEEDRDLIARYAPRYRDCPLLPVSSTLKVEADRLRADGRAEVAESLLARSGYPELEAELVDRVVGRAKALRQANLCRTVTSAMTQVQGREQVRLRSAEGDPALEAELKAEEARCAAFTRRSAGWRNRLEEEFRRLRLRLEADIDKGVRQAEQAAELELAEGGLEAMRSVGRNLGDAIQGHWLDVNLACQRGCTDTVDRVAKALAVEGFELSLETLPLPERDWELESVSAGVEEGLGSIAERAAAEATRQQEVPWWRKALRGLAVGATVLGVASGVGIPLLLVAPGAIDMVQERVTKRRREDEAKVKTATDALRFVQESARAARDDMRETIGPQLERARDVVEGTIEARIEERRGELEAQLAAHRGLATAAQEQRDKDRRTAQQRLDRAGPLLEAADAARAKLASDGDARQARKGRRSVPAET